jgi:hypothetical protein
LATEPSGDIEPAVEPDLDDEEEPNVVVAADIEKEQPAEQEGPTHKVLSSLLFSTNAPVLVVGDDAGSVSCYILCIVCYRINCACIVG